MVEFIPHLALWGQRFSPTEVEGVTGLLLAHKNEPGENGRYGKYRGQPMPFGSASLEPPESVPEADRLDWLIERAAVHLETFRRLGAEELILHVNVPYWDQCNMEFSPSEIAAIAALGVPFTITCWKSSQDQGAPFST
jgi:hypothetical protein